MIEPWQKRHKGRRGNTGDRVLAVLLMIAVLFAGSLLPCVMGCVSARKIAGPDVRAMVKTEVHAALRSDEIRAGRDVYQRSPWWVSAGIILTVVSYVAWNEARDWRRARRGPEICRYISERPVIPHG